VYGFDLRVTGAECWVRWPRLGLVFALAFERKTPRSMGLGHLPGSGVARSLNCSYGLELRKVGQK
jgi:hypothetical protein